MKPKMSDPGSRYLRRRSKRSLDDLNHLRTFFDRPNLPRSAGDRCFGGPTIEIEPDRSLSLLSDQPGKVMVQQSMLGYVLALQLCSAIEQQNVFTLENILRIRSRTKRKYANKKKVFVIFLRIFTCVLFQYLFWEKCAVFIYLVYYSLALVLMCIFIIIYNNFE